ncbi:MAG: hypothetical protein E7172_05385 [Firmicutes bacterium]|nr:hypothetical protein [Bacillota bacterium]
MDSYLEEFKKKKKNRFVKNNKKNSYITKILVSLIFFLGSVIYINYSEENKVFYKEYVYTESLPFAKIKNKYEKLFGSVMPISNEKEKMVFSGKIMYKAIEDYLDGEKLTVNSNSLVSNITSGIVVFIGEKEGFGKTIIVQGIDGVDIWYGNVTNISVQLYDYLENDTVMGEVDGQSLYLVIKKEGNNIKYEEYKA